MTVFATLLRKDLREICRTWRLWVLGGTLLFAAVSGPFLARYLPELLMSLMSEQAAVLSAVMPDPSHLSAQAQWISDLGQLGTLALCLVAGSVIAAELADGSALFTLTRPVGRGSFLLAKVVALSAVTAAVLAVATLINATVTWLVFGSVTVAALLAASAAWLLGALLIIAVASLVGATTSSPLGAAAGAIGAVLALGIAASWGPAVRWSPAGINELAARWAGEQSAQSVWPLLTGSIAGVVLISAAVVVLRHREL